MRASLIVTAFNEGSLLTKTVEACVEAIDGLDCELVVADDASTDGSSEIVTRRFPMVRYVRHDRRRGASPTKALGATSARGEVLVFLDGHSKPEHDAIARLVSAVEAVNGTAILTPATAALDVALWTNDPYQIGHGYRFDLYTLECSWQSVEEMARAGNTGGLELYESAAFIGCAVAMSRRFYQQLWGFDKHMRSWGLEDLDMSLKCWLMGSRILHDPRAVVGHRFQHEFTSYSVPPADVLLNELRLARKNFTHAVWHAWVAGRRHRTPWPLEGAPEGLWARAWHLFEGDRDSVEQERAYLHARRPRDEFWYADRFGLAWPRLGGGVEAGAAPAVHASVSPSASPSPPPTPVAEIQVNNTPAASDDVVLVICTHPSRRSTVNCRIRLISAGSGPVTVVLTDPSGRLRFPAAGDTTRTLTLPPGGGFVAFQISGQTPSTGIGDATIVAHVGGAGGPACASRPVSVVSFDSAQIGLTSGSNYQFVGNSYTTVGGVAILFASKARIRPGGVNCTAPQLVNLRVGIMQESSNFVITETWDTPAITWLGPTPSGTTVVVPTTMRQTTTYAPSVTQPVNDGLAGASPLYERSATALVRPQGCPGGGGANSSDTPSQSVPPTFSLPATSGGVVVGTVTWTRRVNTTRKEHFRTFCVSFDTATNAFCNQRQAIWDINLDSAAAGQHAVAAADGPPTVTPATGVQANNAPTSTTNAGVGAATTTFTKP